MHFPQWDERSFSVRSGQIFWTFRGLPSHKALSLLRTKHAGFLPRTGSLRFQTHPLASGLCIWLWGNVISFGWSSLGIWKGAWNVSSYLLRPCLQSTHFKFPGSPTDLCRCLPWFLAHRHRQGHAGRGLLRMAHLSGSWSNLCIDVQKFRKGLSAVHSDKSAANICKPRQWRSQQSCLAYIALDDRLPVIDSTMRMQCHCDKTRIPFGAIEAAKRTLPQSSVQTQNVHFPQWDERSFSVRSGQIVWTFRGLPSHKALSLLRTKHAGFLPRTGSLRFQTHPLASGLCIWLWGNVISFGWSSLGIWKGAWNVSSYLLRPCLLSTHFKPPGSPTDLCRCLPWFLAHRHRQGHAGRGLLRMAHLSGSWSNLCIDVQKFRKGLSAMHSCPQINQLQTFANPDNGAASSHVWPTLHWMTGCQW